MLATAHLIVDLVAFIAVVTAVLVLVLIGRADAALLAAAAAFVSVAFRVYRSHRISGVEKHR
ncbi:hypothetical protein [Nocardia salmonicida]